MYGIVSLSSLRSAGHKERSCIGRTKSKGIRCSNSISTRGQNISLSFTDLDHMSDARRAQLFKEVATDLLCKHLHGYQSDIIAETWEEEYQQNVPSREVIRVLGAKTVHAAKTDFPVEPRRRYYTRQSNYLVQLSDSIDSFFGKPIRASGLVAMLARSLAQSDGVGWVYTFSRSSSPGYFKIGTTTKTPVERVNKWGRECRYSAKVCDAATAQMNFCKRGEQLVHILLNHSRQYEPVCNGGNGCGKSHREWFEVSELLAVKAVNLVARAFSLGLYNSNTRELSTTWYYGLDRLNKHASIDDFGRWINSIAMERQINSLADALLRQRKSSIAKPLPLTSHVLPSIMFQKHSMAPIMA